MRLFVGCEVGPVVAEAAAGLIEQLRTRTARLAPHARLTWVSKERLHFTVRFIGSVDASSVPALTDALASPLAQAPFDAVVQGLGVFPDRRPPRVIWAGLQSGADHMSELARATNDRLRPLVGDDPETLRPHLTLARVKEPQGLRVRTVFEGLDAVPLGVTRVDAVTLFESRPSSAGVRYVPICRTPLQGR